MNISRVLGTTNHMTVAGNAGHVDTKRLNVGSRNGSPVTRAVNAANVNLAQIGGNQGSQHGRGAQGVLQMMGAAVDRVLHMAVGDAHAGPNPIPIASASDAGSRPGLHHRTNVQRTRDNLIETIRPGSIAYEDSGKWFHATQAGRDFVGKVDRLTGELQRSLGAIDDSPESTLRFRRVLQGIDEEARVIARAASGGEASVERNLTHEAATQTLHSLESYLEVRGLMYADRMPWEGVDSGTIYRMSAEDQADRTKKHAALDLDHSGLEALEMAELVELSLHSRFGDAAYYSPFSKDAYHIEKARVDAYLNGFENGKEVVRARKVALEAELETKQQAVLESGNNYRQGLDDIRRTLQLRDGIQGGVEAVVSATGGRLSVDDVNHIIASMEEGISLIKADPKFQEGRRLNLELNAIKARLLAIEHSGLDVK